MSLDPRFVGREKERQAFQHLLDSPYGAEQIYFIWGGGGMGKTWLTDALLSDARQHKTPTYHVAQQLIDTYATSHRYIEGIMAAIIGLLPEANFPTYFQEKEKVDQARQQAGYAQAGLEVRLNALAAAFRQDLQTFVAEQPIVLAFDTFEHVQDTAVGHWILANDGLQMSGLLCIIAGRKPNPMDIEQPTLPGLNDEAAIAFYDEYDPPLFGEHSEADRVYVRQVNRHAAGNPLLLGLGLRWLDSVNLSDEALEALPPAAFQRRIASWLSPATAVRAGTPQFSGLSVDQSEALRQTFLCMAYINRRFNRTLLAKLVEASYVHVHGVTADAIWDLLKDNFMRDFFYVKDRPDDEIQLHDKLAEMLRLNVLPDAFDDITSQRVRQLANDVVNWYDEFIANAADEQERAHLQVEKLAYALRLDILADCRQPEWQGTDEARQLMRLLAPDMETAVPLLQSYQQQNSDLLNRLIIQEISLQTIGQLPASYQYEICATLGQIARNSYLLADSAQFWQCALTMAETAVQKIRALDGSSNSLWQSEPQLALHQLDEAWQISQDDAESAPLQPELLHGIGFVYRQMQDLESALDWYKQARGSAQQHDPNSIIAAKILNDMGYALLLIGDYHEAEAHISLAALKRGRLRDSAKAEVDRLKAELKEAKDPPLKTQLEEELKQREGEYRAALLNLGMTYNTLGQLARQNPSDTTDATGYYDEALAIFDELKNPYWQAMTHQARGDAYRRLSLARYYKDRLDSSAQYDQLSEENIQTSLDLCEQHGFIDLQAITYRRMGRLFHDRALKIKDDPQKVIELIDEAYTYFEKGIKAANASQQTNELLENAVEIAFLADDLLRAYRQRRKNKRLAKKDKARAAEYIQRLELQIEAHAQAKLQIYQFPVFKDLLAIEWGAHYFELGEYDQALAYYLDGFTGLASDPGYGSARCRAHIDHLFNNIRKLNDDQLKQSWYHQFMEKWQTTPMQRGAKISVAEGQPKLMAQFRLNAMFAR